jgi:hypothetical protein
MMKGRKMRVFQELSVHGPYEALRRLPDEIEHRLSGGWSRNRLREAEVRRAPSTVELYCFHCQKEQGKEAADLWMSLRGSDELRVSNIVPSTIAELSYKQYNDILGEFAKRFAIPAAESIGLEISISYANVAIGDVFPPNVVSALKDFSENANRASLALHPLDKERWETFVIEAHRAHTPLATDILYGWLTEEGGWPREAADRLSIDYEKGRALLDEYQRQLQDA